MRETVVTATSVVMVQRRPTLTRISGILWGSWTAVFLGAVIVGVIIANENSPDEDAGWALIIFPFAASIIWIPLGIASLILAIIALVRRELGKGWAIALIAINAISLFCIWTYRVYWIFWIAHLFVKGSG